MKDCVRRAAWVRRGMQGGGGGGGGWGGGGGGGDESLMLICYFRYEKGPNK